MQLIYKKELEQIIQRCCAGNSRAQKQLYKLFAAKMYAICLRYMKNKMEAEDVLQEGFIRTFKKIDTYNRKGSFEGWMKTIFINVALRQLDKNKKLNQQLPIEDVIDLTVPQATISFENLDYKDLIQMVSELPDGYRIVFIMYAIEGFTHEEIANHLNISQGTSKSQLSRARSLLRAKIEKINQHVESYLSEQFAG
tara:strand:+ start:6797 stop:7384 length:588 start_codon:yes stop_codon:yes gene_type:complete